MSPNARRVKAASTGGKASKDSVALKPSAIKDASLRDYAVRFAFGAAVSVLAGLVGLRFGPRVGGLFLAFPAILPAALSLIEKKDGEGAADADAQGGIVGGVGMLAFALVVFLAVKGMGATLTLLLALLGWTLVSVGLYLALRQLWPAAWR
ncbi:MAG: DUF3147 family protein [Candidatus Dormibacteria bacterium]